MNTKAIYDSRYRELVVHICEVRKGRGMTQAELGRQLRLSRQSVQKIESCEVRLDLVRYVTLCRILGIDAGQLLARLEEPSDEDDSFYLSDLYTRQEMILLSSRKISGQFLTIVWWPKFVGKRSYCWPIHGHFLPSKLDFWRFSAFFEISANCLSLK